MNIRLTFYKESGELDALKCLTLILMVLYLILKPSAQKALILVKNSALFDKHYPPGFATLTLDSNVTIGRNLNYAGKMFTKSFKSSCNAAKTSIRTAIKEVLRTQWSTQSLEWFANKLNPKKV